MRSQVGIDQEKRRKREWFRAMKKDPIRYARHLQRAKEWRKLNPGLSHGAK